jgi:serine/threonine-protein kinase HipA
MSSEPLLVFYSNRQVGTLRQTEENRFSFAYTREWLSSPDSFAISLSLPLSEDAGSNDAAQKFFSNLLPEGRLRQLVTRRLGISEDNDYELLKAIGGECAGALTILPESIKNRKLSANEYRPLSLATLKKLEAEGPVYPAITATSGVRLSLAGAQDKLPVLHKNGKLFLPLRDSPSSHILKFANRDFKHLPANEIITTWTARDCGIPVVNVSPFPLGGSVCCLVERYDRRLDSKQNIMRLHQEDLCQALGVGSSRKYEQEGGPSFARCFALIERNSTNPVADTDAFIKWQVFNVLGGNSDGHAKNISFLYERANTLRLAPFYDLVCTACYPNLGRNLALSIGNCADPGQVGEKHWRLFAEQVGIRFHYLRDVVVTMAELLPTTVRNAAERYRSMHQDSPILDLIVRTITTRVRRSLKLLKP